MMTHKDFDNLAKEIAWELHLGKKRIDECIPMLRESDWYVQDMLTGKRDYISGCMIGAIVNACSKSNPTFKVDKFYQAIRNYNINARSIGNGIFD